mgnify:CR=1 FL=1
MRKFTVNLLTLSLGLALMPMAEAANSPQQKQLLEQVRLGESTQREDLVRQSLYRLELIDPNNPDVIAARFRYLLRQGLPARPCGHGGTGSAARHQLEHLAAVFVDRAGGDFGGVRVVETRIA